MGKKKVAEPHTANEAEPLTSAEELSRTNTFQEAVEEPVTSQPGRTTSNGLASPINDDTKSCLSPSGFVPGTAPPRLGLNNTSKHYLQDGLVKLVDAGSKMVDHLEFRTPFAGQIRRRLQPYTNVANFELSRAAEHVDEQMLSPFVNKYEAKGAVPAVAFAVYNVATFFTGFIWGLLPRHFSESEYTLDVSSGLLDVKPENSPQTAQGTPPVSNSLPTDVRTGSKLDVLKRGVDTIFYSPFSMLESLLYLVSKPPAAYNSSELNIVRLPTSQSITGDESSSYGRNTAILLVDDTHYCKNLGWDAGNWLKERAKHGYFVAVETCSGTLDKSWPVSLKMPEANMADLGDWFARQLPPSIMSSLTKLAESIRLNGSRSTASYTSRSQNNNINTQNNNNNNTVTNGRRTHNHCLAT